MKARDNTRPAEYNMIFVAWWALLIFDAGVQHNFSLFYIVMTRKYLILLPIKIKWQVLGSRLKMAR